MRRVNMPYQHWLLLLTINVSIILPLVGLVVYMTIKFSPIQSHSLTHKIISQLMNILLEMLHLQTARSW